MTVTFQWAGESWRTNHRAPHRPREQPGAGWRERRASHRRLAAVGRARWPRGRYARPAQRPAEKSQRTDPLAILAANFPELTGRLAAAASLLPGLDEVLTSTGARIIKTPVRSPRGELATRATVRGNATPRVPGPPPGPRERHLRKILAEYEQHYNEHRPHQAREQRPPLYEPDETSDLTVPIRRKKTVQGLISEYRRAA